MGCLFLAQGGQASSQGKKFIAGREAASAALDLSWTALLLGRKKLRWIAKTWIRKKPGLQNLDRKSWAARVCDKKKKSAPAVTEALFLTVKFTLKFEL